MVRTRSLLDPKVKAAFLSLVEQRFGLRVSDHQARHLDSAVPQLLAEAGFLTPWDLYSLLAEGRRPDLLETLAARLTTGETHFFRVGPHIEALQRVVLPAIVSRRLADRRLRLWSAGCSTGEEPYTLAILLCQQLAMPPAWDIQLLATDVSRPALDAGRRATYGEWSFRETPEEVRRRYFVPAGKQWRLVEPIRQMVRFAHLNLAADALLPRDLGTADFDLILCRNVTIYFSPEATQRLYRRLADALAPEGWLVLGPSDPVPLQPGLLEPVYLPGAVLWQRTPVEGKDGPVLAPPTPLIERPRPRHPLPVAPSAPAASGTGPPLPAPLQEAVLDQEQVWAAQAGDRLAARQHAEQAVRARPLHAEAHLLLGMLLLEEGAADAALESLRRATFLAPHLALAHFGLGRACREVGNQGRARAALTQARWVLAAAPDDEPVPGCGGLVAGELRHAVESQLLGLRRASKP
ncbi:MAG: protein-glutamate O-methyltransferase CheR [Chloroflexi bacterium]|nr:protein-glutamate O-methyltransferase CheR [Chloroflexota bacterium]